MNAVNNLLGLSSLHHKNIRGAGITVAVTDTGIVRHPDFGKRIIGFQDMLHQKTNPYDDSSHGTHLCGIIGGDGRSSYGLYTGIAPACNLLGVKMLDQEGNGSTANMLKALEWIEHNQERFKIRILNISIGTVPDVKHKDRDSLTEAVERLWDQGIVVVAAAGNQGPEISSITAPGISKKVITVGSFDDKGYRDASGKMIRHYSGRGPTADCVCKPEVVAPGADIMACNASFQKKGKGYYCKKSGTSMATAVVSGCIALLLSKYPEMSNVDVKLKLRESCMDLGLPKNQQGWGAIVPTALLR